MFLYSILKCSNGPVLNFILQSLPSSLGVLVKVRVQKRGFSNFFFANFVKVFELCLVMFCLTWPGEESVLLPPASHNEGDVEAKQEGDWQPCISV